MLGSMVADVLAESEELSVTTTARTPDPPAHGFDAERDSVAELLSGRDIEWIVNAIGVIKPRIDESDPESVYHAIEVNSRFPYLLAKALEPGQRVIQIATDCVYSGTTGGYDEDAPHDPTDVYGKTKSLGEAPCPDFLHLRCSIIGPERGEARSLLGWMLSQPRDAEVSGYTNHRWNGVTTLHFAKLCRAVILERVTGLPCPLHVVPGDTVTKAELLELGLGAFGRSDVTVRPGPADTVVDRTLTTKHTAANRRLWEAAGCGGDPPSVAAMVSELAARVREPAVG